MKPKLFMLIGLPGSGKSTYAIKLKEKYSANIHSSDVIRCELFNDENNQSNNTSVFETLHYKIKEDLLAGINTIYDATNISHKKRMSFLQTIKNLDCEKTAVMVATPYMKCVEYNLKRSRYVPESIIKNMHLGFYVPYWYEGWDDIQIYKTNGLLKESDFINDAKFFMQDNVHHSLTIGEHCLKAKEFVLNNVDKTTKWYYPLVSAAALHDCGKPFTKSYINSKGRESKEAHYYNHHHVGAYNSLFYEESCNILDRAILIQNHMQPYFWEQNERNKNKYQKLWGDELFKSVLLLHEADRHAK